MRPGAANKAAPVSDSRPCLAGAQRLIQINARPDILVNNAGIATGTIRPVVGAVHDRDQRNCHCGKVGYHANAKPLFTFVCHCTTCQKATRSAFGVMIALPAAALTINGITKTYDFVGDSGKPKRHRSALNAAPA